jgi:hypothetical protein
VIEAGGAEAAGDGLAALLSLYALFGCEEDFGGQELFGHVHLLLDGEDVADLVELVEDGGGDGGRRTPYIRLSTAGQASSGTHRHPFFDVVFGGRISDEIRYGSEVAGFGVGNEVFGEAGENAEAGLGHGDADGLAQVLGVMRGAPEGHHFLIDVQEAISRDFLGEADFAVFVDVAVWRDGDREPLNDAFDDLPDAGLGHAFHPGHFAGGNAFDVDTLVDFAVAGSGRIKEKRSGGDRETGRRGGGGHEIAPGFGLQISDCKFQI